MHTTKRGEPLAINQALNKSRQKLGLSMPVWMGIVIASLMALLLRFFVLSVVMFLAITASLSRIQCWDFAGVSKDYPDLIEPLMIWLLRRIDDVVYDPKNLGVPKHVVIEEIFSNMKNKQLLEGALASIKQVRKNLGGVTLIGQSANDLGENADSIVNSCTSFLLLPDATFNRQFYGELFKMTEQQLNLFESLGPREGHDARIYTNDADGLGARLATDVSKTSAVDFRKSPNPAPQKNAVVQTHEYADPNHRIAAVAAAYAEHPSSTVIIARNPAERRELNQLIRAELQASGTVAPDSRSLPVYVAKELANPKLAAQYAPGDIIQYRQGSPAGQGIPNDSAAVVVATDTRNNQLTVRTSHGDEVIYSPHLTTAMTNQSKVYREEHQEFAPGDRVRMTQPNALRGIRKGDFGTIAAIGDNLEVRLDKGENVQLTKEQAKHIEHGYAVESLKTGAPDKVLFSQSGSSQATSEAVSLARTGRDVSVYTSDSSARMNAVAPTIALPEQLKPSIALPVQQQSEAPSPAIAPEQAPVIHHRHSRGR